jgi:hypothetical protein
MSDTATAEDAVVARVMRRLLPFLLLMYMLAFLDRANIGFAQKALQHDTGLSNAAFAFGAGVFFVGYALFEVPSNLLLHRVGGKALDVPDHGDMGACFRRDGIRAYGHHVLCPALCAWRS